MKPQSTQGIRKPPAPGAGDPRPDGAPCFEPVPEAVDESTPLPPGARRVPCERIEEVLFDYMARELGPEQSLLVREHLRRCAKCRAKAAEISRTLEILEARDPGAGAPEALSPRRRRRVLWTKAHPVLDFIFVHHSMASLALTIIAVSLILWLLITRIGGRSPFRVFWVDMAERAAGDGAGEAQGQDPQWQDADAPSATPEEIE